MIKQNQTRLIGILSTLLVMQTLPAWASGLSGENVYTQNCMVCHGDDGAGNMPGVPDLVEGNTWQKQSEPRILERLIQGIPGKEGSIGMPAKGGNPQLTQQQLLVSLKYLRLITKE